MAAEKMHSGTENTQKKAWDAARKFRRDRWGGNGNIAVVKVKQGMWRWTITR